MPGTTSGNEQRRVLHIARLRVPLFEADLGGGVYHGNYFHLFEIAREEFLRDLDYPYSRFMKQQLHLTVAEVSCTYQRPVFYDDVIEIHTEVPERRIRSLSFLQTIYRQDGDKGIIICTQARMNMVCIRYTGLSSVIPAEFVRLLDERIQRSPVLKTGRDELLQ
jgi:acyl-CoA thioester hydrolase